MFLRIETEVTQTSTHDSFYQFPLLIGDSFMLPIDLPAQERSNWCWASIASAVAAYYHQKTVPQTAIVYQVLGDLIPGFQYKGILPDDYNINTTLDLPLTAMGCFSHWIPFKPSFSRIQAELNNGNPVAVRINWLKGGGHYVMIKGYEGRREILHLDDPLNGPSNCSYRDFPQDYGFGAGVWTDTFWMAKSKLTIDKLTT